MGEIKKGTAEDPISNESDASSVADGALSPDDPIDTPASDGAVRPATPRDGGGGGTSPEAGSRGSDARVDPPLGTPDAQVPDTGTPTGKRIPVFVAVGYSGVRMMSKDLGKTWGNIVVSDPTRANKDDNNLLRAVKYGAGLFVAVGYKVWTSPDAVTWTERTPATSQWMGGMQYGANLFVAAGGAGTSMFSSDGISWTKGKDRNGEAARTVAFGNGTFIAATDANNWWSTTDGLNWSVLSSGHNGSKAVWCSGKAFSDAAACSSDPLARNLGRTVLGENVYISAASGKIERSEDGKTWTMAADTSANPVEDVAFGYVTE